MSHDIPTSVQDDIATAVQSAIDSGVSAHDFKRWVALLWSEALTKKRTYDAKTLSE